MLTNTGDKASTGLIPCFSAGKLFMGNIVCRSPTIGTRFKTFNLGWGGVVGEEGCLRALSTLFTISTFKNYASTNGRGSTSGSRASVTNPTLTKRTFSIPTMSRRDGGFCLIDSLKQGNCCRRGAVTRLVKGLTRGVSVRFVITTKSARRFRKMTDISSPL